MIRYTFRLKDYRSILKGFAKAFNLKIEKKKLTFPDYMGHGHVYASNISPDISYVILDFTLKDELILGRRKTPDYGLSLSFIQIDIRDFFRLTEKNVSITSRSPRLNNIYLSSTNVEMEMVISKNSPVKMVVVFFSPHFIRKCIKKDILVDLQMYTDSGAENIYREPITFEYKHLLDEIFKTDTNLPLSYLALQNRVLMLTEKFLAAFLERESEESKLKNSRLKERDLQALKEVEEILSKPELDKFPSIEVLSKTAMMSSTKLKTKFKSVYGMKLYEYFNRNRLEKAKELLQTGKYSVKEVGLDIGFSNLSNFAKAFKKEFGILPNEMLRMGQNSH
jgi:AraC-like DNA-binding protein